MASLTQEIEVAGLTALKDAYEANKVTLLATITAAEGGAEAFIAKGIKSAVIPKTGGILGEVVQMLAPEIEAAAAAEASAMLAKYGPEVIYTFIDRELTLALAAAVKSA